MLVPRERAHGKLGVYFRAWTWVNALVQGTREVWYATETLNSIKGEKEYVYFFEGMMVTVGRLVS